MTEPLPPLTDEDLSAVLDGEAGPEVVARVQADPAARSRLDAFRAAGDALRQVPVETLDAETVDDLIQRALSEAVDTAATSDDAEGSPDAVVTPLAPPRGRRGAPRWLVAAAIIALVAVGLGLVWSGVSNDGDPDLAEMTAEDTGGSSDAERGSDSAGGGAGRQESESSEGSSDTSADEAPPDAENPSVAPTTTATGDSATPTALPDLGAFESFDDLRTSLRTSFPDPAPSPRRGDVPSSTQVDRCDTQMQQVFEIPGDPVNTGIATVAGQDVIVFEYDRASFADGSPTTFVTAVSPESCAAELTFERTPG